jgi:mRNA interferase MazF
MVNNLERFQVWLVDLNPTQGSEINKRRPCLIISPNEIMSLATVVVVPMTTKGFKIPSTVDVDFNETSGLIILNQIRTIDKNKLVKKVGVISRTTQIEICNRLQEMFAY